MATKKRKCGCCREYGHFDSAKSPCPNKARVQKAAAEAKAAKLKAREEAKTAKLKERERKRVKKEKEKKLAPPKAGTSVKGRDGSTRHGYIISYSKHHCPPVTEADIDNRNTRLGIDPTKCFWCKLSDKKCGDHLFPACNTKHSCYSWSSALCIVPSCLSCNSLKGGKIIEEWVKELPRLGWTLDQIETLVEWAEENEDKLVLQKDDIEHVEKQFPIINKFHALLDQCVKTKTDIRELVASLVPTTLAFGKGPNLKQKKLTNYFKR
jgi:hypothetical protein